MQINYLKNLQSFMDKKRWRRDTKGLDEAEITKVESQMEKNFLRHIESFSGSLVSKGFVLGVKVMR
ncbi:MAG: hypothetical protein F9K23_14210 [Bacteroidetes bacterium]|nr:MAG: hypothetical protein F9K23_14210 [Bacteroidota bacterium]